MALEADDRRTGGAERRRILFARALTRRLPWKPWRQ